MPELPEVETISRQLHQALKGQKIIKVTILSAKNFVGNPQEVVGQRIIAVERRAKMIWFKLANNLTLAVHLKLTGQLILGQGQPGKYTRVFIDLGSGQKLFFNDVRKFGWMKVIKNRELAKMNLDFGLEPFDKTFTSDYLKKVFSRTSKPVKLVLLDQTKIAGIGNIYANEALFAAGIAPSRPAKGLSNKEIKKLRAEILKVLQAAIKYKGTSDRDEAYRQIDGAKGQFQNFLQVYRRQGQKCPRCGGMIKRIALGGRGTFFCSYCQK